MSDNHQFNPLAHRMQCTFQGRNFGYMLRIEHPSGFFLIKAKPARKLGLRHVLFAHRVRNSLPAHRSLIAEIAAQA